MASNCVKAAKMRDSGVDLETIADHFGWTMRTASVNVARGRNWEQFLTTNAKNRKKLRAIARTEKRKKDLPKQFKALCAEANSLGLDVAALLR
jgi:(p)ppGpp synthase/HD superfamily hydrolase